MILRFILLIVLAVVILGGANWFVLFSLGRLLLIKSPSTKIIIAILILSITFGFLIISAISRVTESQIVKYLYIISSVLIGVWVFVLFFLIISWAIVGVLHLLGIYAGRKIITWAMLFSALIYSAYNIYNAYDIKIKSISIPMKGLPDFWKGKKIVQLSDVHLGNINGADFMQKIADLTNAQNPDAIVITGDLFDGMDGNLTPLIAPLNSLKAPEGIYYVTGNHELYLGLDKVLQIIGQTDIQFIDDRVVHKDGLQFAGISYGQDLQPQDIKSILEADKNYDKNMPTILLYHIPLLSKIKEAEQMGIDLQLSGHTHVGQLMPFKLITEIIYQGYDYGLHKIGNFYEYTSSGVGTWGPPMRSGNSPEIVSITLK